jgi:Rrf2 family transcriptional regulator, cysteine metabolism repressor
VNATLMKISVKSEYALNAVLDLAIQGSSQPVKIADIAKRQKIPQKFLELILAELKKAGFVDSRRGAEGGYLLARAADTITIGEVLRSVEGGKTSRAASRKRLELPFGEMWQRIDDCISQVVDQTTFADLARSWSEKQSRYVPNWEI